MSKWRSPTFQTKKRSQLNSLTIAAPEVIWKNAATNLFGSGGCAGRNRKLSEDHPHMQQTYIETADEELEQRVRIYFGSFFSFFFF